MTRRKPQKSAPPNSAKITKRLIITSIAVAFIVILIMQFSSSTPLEFPSTNFLMKPITGTSQDIRASYDNSPYDANPGTTSSPTPSPTSDTSLSPSTNTTPTPLIAIYTFPSGSTVTINDKYAGETVSGKWFVYEVKLNTEYSIKITKAGYKTVTNKVTVTKDSPNFVEKRSYQLESTTTPTPTPTPSSSTTSTPSSTPTPTPSISNSYLSSVPLTITVNTPASIYIEGSLIKSNTKSVQKLLPPGDYIIEATAPQYIGSLKRVTLTKDPMTVSFVLKSALGPAPTTTITSTSTPSPNTVNPSETPALSASNAEFRITSVTWSKPGTIVKQNYMSVAQGSDVDVWAIIGVTKSGIMKHNSFGMTVKKDLSYQGDEVYNPSTQSFLDLSGGEVNRAMIPYTGPDKTVTSGQLYTIKVGTFKTQSSGISTYFAKGYVDPTASNNWKNTYDPTSTSRHKVTTYVAYTHVTPPTTSHPLATFTVKSIAFAGANGPKYSVPPAQRVGQRIYMYAYLVSTTPGYVDKYSFAVAAKKDIKWRGDKAYSTSSGNWVSSDNEGTQKYTGSSFYLSGSKYVQVGYFIPDEITHGAQTSYFGVVEYFAKGYILKNPGSNAYYQATYDPTNEGVRNRVYVEN